MDGRPPDLTDVAQIILDILAAAEIPIGFSRIILGDPDRDGAVGAVLIGNRVVGEERASISISFRPPVELEATTSILVVSDSDRLVGVAPD